MNNKPVFRNPDKYQVLEWREWMRDNLPNGKSGMVVEDIDLVPLMFGPLINRQRDEDGKFMLIEIKTMFGQMGYAQRRLFSMMHKLLRKADPDRKYYIGFYLVRWDNGKPESVNNARVTEQKFIEFMTGKVTLESMFDA